MKKNLLITLLLVSPIFLSCQSYQNIERNKTNIENMPNSAKGSPDVRGIISYENYQVVVANGNETVSEIASRLSIDPKKFSLFNGLIEEYRPRQGELLALNEYIEPLAKRKPSAWSQKNTKNVLEKVKEKRHVSVSPENFAKHKVESGESIYSIARLYNVSVTSLAKLNKLDAEFTIYVGQNIIIPVKLTKTKQPKNTVEVSNRKPSVIEKKEQAETSIKRDFNNLNISLKRPVQGKIVSKYNPNSEKGKNQGIDFQTVPGSPVLAAAYGTVALITDSTENFEKIVLIRHKNNFISIYGRISNVLVDKNQVVNMGEKIGTTSLNKTDEKKFSILHFELRDGTKSVNPEDYFN